MSCVFNDKEEIKHDYKKEQSWIGTYSKAQNVIVYNGTKYETPSAFALAHIKKFNPERPGVNGWDWCKVKRGGAWIFTRDLECIHCPGKK